MKKKCPGLVDFRELLARVPSAFSAGLWKQALLVMLNDFLRLKLPKSLVLPLFDKYDKNESGFLDPIETFCLLKNLPRMGLKFPQFRDLIREVPPLGMGFTGTTEADLRKSFMMIDVDQSGMVDLDKFIGGIGFIMLELIPRMVLDKIGLSTKTIVKILCGALVTLLTVFAFILLAMAAFTPPGAAASAIQSSLGTASSVVVKGEGAPKDQSKLSATVKELIDAVMDVPKSKRREMDK
jgi:hypothetical protein